MTRGNIDNNRLIKIAGILSVVKLLKSRWWNYISTSPLPSLAFPFHHLQSLSVPFLPLTSLPLLFPSSPSSYK